ncbi:hypothetical protein Ddc_02038 [Ditylenchus destructor]|nr:hypothetical protein Ddc_02038 [Ditylenchus destructor]
MPTLLSQQPIKKQIVLRTVKLGIHPTQRQRQIPFVVGLDQTFDSNNCARINDALNIKQRVRRTATLVPYIILEDAILPRLIFALSEFVAFGQATAL